MKKNYSAAGIALRVWFCTAIIAGLCVFVMMQYNEPGAGWVLLPVAILASFIAGFPALVVMLLLLNYIRNSTSNPDIRMLRFILLQLLITVLYGTAGGMLEYFFRFFYSNEPESFLYATLLITGFLFGSALLALIICIKPVTAYLAHNKTNGSRHPQILQLIFNQKSKTNIVMENSQQMNSSSSPSNKILIKGIITGVLILVMLIPTLFISNLITEREARQKEVVKEVSSKWASDQTLSGPFLTVPYNTTYINSEGKKVAGKTNLIVLANKLNVNAVVTHEERPRSIYKVLLYKTVTDFSGDFKIKFPSDINIENADFANARLCFALNDFKGIEEEIYVDFNHEKLLLSPGLPVNDLGKTGLSVPVSLSAADFTGSIPFAMQVKIKGSEQLHFIPLSANSKFNVQSQWPNPSFDGAVLPGSRTVSDKGFTAEWNFNQANLPFGTVVFENALNTADIAFGVSFVQPADQYNKTMRSVKYAILFIGLTFAFFFIIELMQKKPFHPVQYILVGLALVIFYTLLLSFSEYILFDYAYGIAAIATVLLISLYAKGHFNSWKTATVFFGLLSCLYGFIFILIRLEDTALLVGSIGLFIVLALVMYASRKINWYGSTGADGEKQVVVNA